MPTANASRPDIEQDWRRVIGAGSEAAAGGRRVQDVRDAVQVAASSGKATRNSGRCRPRNRRDVSSSRG